LARPGYGLLLVDGRDGHLTGLAFAVREFAALGQQQAVDATLSCSAIFIA
jgi:hypothetical protein